MKKLTILIALAIAVAVAVGLLSGPAGFGPGTAAGASTFTVNTTGDDSDASAGDGTCETATAGECTLRAAIEEANELAGADTIAFNIPGAGPHTISPDRALPDITEPVTIDGFTQTGASPNTNGPGLATNAVLMIELEGSSAGCCFSGLTITAGSSSVRGLVINRFTHSGILLDSGDGNVIEGNYLGSNTAGSAALGNILDGISVQSSGNTIGGTSPGKRNVISGNGNDGIYVLGADLTGNIIQGNYIGTDASGAAALGNVFYGIQIFGADMSLIGGTTPGARNVISGSGQAGIKFEIGNTGNIVQGNYIGTNASGTAALGNIIGIILPQASNVIGGTASGAGNLISGNVLIGVILSGIFGGNIPVQGNYIGTQADGTSPLGNGSHGVRLSSWNNTIGGPAAGAANTIAFNGGHGVGGCPNCTTDAKNNQISQNSIHSNAGLGIDLGVDGVTANDLGDSDDGDNRLQNFPVLTSAIQGSTNIEGSLNSKANTEFRIEFFANTACDPSGNGEGEIFLGFDTVTTGGTGDVSFSVSLPTTVAVGQFITATATDPAGNTSEFSECVEVEEEVTPTKQPDPGDTDNDGCSDVEENGPDETLGGRRDFQNFWDFLALLRHYNTMGDPSGFDPDAAEPPLLTYWAAVDRDDAAHGGDPWDEQPADGNIGFFDFLALLRQYDHSCKPPP